MGFGGMVTSVKGISDRRRLPRLGKIRLGFKVAGSNGGEVPAELPFFLLPKDVALALGPNDCEQMVERAKSMGVTRKDVLTFISRQGDRMRESIDMMLPINDQGACFPQAYKFYGSSKGIKCIGNGEYAWEDGKERSCPCERLKTEDNPKGACTLRGNLMCLLPQVNMGGIYQIDVGSYNSVIDVNSGMDYVSSVVGRFAMVPLLLRRIPTTTHHNDQKQIHFTMQLLLHPSVTIDLLNRLRTDTARVLETSSRLALEAPRDINPEYDEEEALTLDEESGDITEPPASAFDKLKQALESAADFTALNAVNTSILDAAKNKELTDKEVAELKTCYVKQGKELKKQAA